MGLYLLRMFLQQSCSSLSLCRKGMLELAYLLFQLVYALLERDSVVRAEPVPPPKAALEH
eukprot:551087-Hanusia_phi.AAC.1